MLESWLAHPSTKHLSIDDPQTTLNRRRIIQEKKFLRLIYEDWYASILAALPAGEGKLLELGSGAGFFREFIPDLITSEIFHLPGVDVVMDAQHLPLSDGVLRGIVMINVMHHLPEPRLFFCEACRCLRPGGVIIMIEPWVTAWSTLVYRFLHHEPFHPKAAAWEFPAQGPLSGANAALPWIIFERDRSKFDQEFRQVRLHKLELIMPFRYLLSGGVSKISLCPSWTYEVWRRLEEALKPYLSRLAMFAQIQLVRVGNARGMAEFTGEKLCEP
jgi:SAM-dependent methyltransferase